MGKRRKCRKSRRVLAASVFEFGFGSNSSEAAAGHWQPGGLQEDVMLCRGQLAVARQVGDLQKKVEA